MTTAIEFIVCGPRYTMVCTAYIDEKIPNRVSSTRGLKEQDFSRLKL